MEAGKLDFRPAVHHLSIIAIMPSAAKTIELSEDLQAFAEERVRAGVPDEVSDSEIDPLTSWRLRKESGVRADVLACRVSEFEEDRHTPNTLAYEAANRGALVFER